MTHDQLILAVVLVLWALLEVWKYRKMHHGE